MGAPTAYFVDPAAGTDDTVGDRGSVIGNPWKSTQFALNNTTRDATDGDLVHLKAGTADTLSAALDFTSYGSPAAAAPFGIRGYTSVTGDGGIGELNGGGSVGIITVAKNGIHFTDMRLHNCGSVRILNLGVEAQIVNCELDNTTGAVLTASSSLRILNSYIHNCGGGLTLAAAKIFNTYFKNDGQAPTSWFLNGAGSTIRNCIFDCDGATVGVQAINSVDIDECAFFGGGGTGSGVAYAGSRSGVFILNNIFEGYSGAGGHGIKNTVTTNIDVYSHNSFFDNETDTLNMFNDFFGSDNEVLSSSPFTDAAGGDFSTPDSTGSVRAEDGGGYPSGFKTGVSQFDINRGAAQDAGQTAVAAGGGYIVSVGPPLS